MEERFQFLHITSYTVVMGLSDLLTLYLQCFNTVENG